MGVIYDHRTPYYQVPQHLHGVNGKLKQLTLAEVKAYLCLHYEAQRLGKSRFQVSDPEIVVQTGLSQKSLWAARRGLVKHGLIEIEEDQGYWYTICDCDGVALTRPAWGNSKRKYSTKHRDFSKLSLEEYAKYYEARAGRLRNDDGTIKAQNYIRCPFPQHGGDNTASLSINLGRGQFKCHAGYGAGGMIEFETLFTGRDKTTAHHTINAILDGKVQVRQEPTHVYVYRDAFNMEVYEVLRYDGTPKFGARRRRGDGYIFGIKGVRKVLYNLPAVIAATTVMIAEGEKDADTVDDLQLPALDGTTVTGTTNPFGAGKWLKEYSPHLAHKRVIILADDDDRGRLHAEGIRKSIGMFTSPSNIGLVTCWDEAKDVTAWLGAGHTREELMTKIESDTGQPWFYPQELTLEP
jgi:hypothetical protein